MREEKSRIYKWDNIKGILICLVVIGHFVDYNTSNSQACKTIFLFIYSFHMPLFILIAGYFHRNARIRDKVLFYCTMGVLLRLVTFIVNKFVCAKDFSLNFLTTDGVAWFMFAMAAWIALSWVLRDCNPGFVFAVALLLGCFSGYDSDLNDTFALSRIIVFFPFYWGGYCLQNSDRFRKLAGFGEDRRRRRIKAAAGGAGIAVWAVICVKCLTKIYYLRPFFTGRNPFSGIYEQTIAGLETRILCYLISALLCLALIMAVPNRKLPFLTKWGGEHCQSISGTGMLYICLIICGECWGIALHSRTDGLLLSGWPSW